MPIVWTMELFKQIGEQKHLNKYDYSKSYFMLCKGNKIVMNIKCNKCFHRFSQRIQSHINRGDGCSECHKDQHYTYEKFIKKAKEVHGDLYDYSTVNKNGKFRVNEDVLIRCKECERDFTQNINTHINSRSGCIICSNDQYTYKKFIKKATIIHQDKYNYDLISKTGIFRSYDKVFIKCNKCSSIFEQRISNHVRGNGCKMCSLNKYTYEKLVEKATKVHDDKYNYSLIDPDGSFRMIDYIDIICKKCNAKFPQKIGSHIHDRKGCPYCGHHKNRSNGEIAVEKYVHDHNYVCVIEYSLPSLCDRRYDVVLHDKKIIIEFDGVQHFDVRQTFHRNEEEFIKDQHTDVIKSAEAIKCGYKIIRIGYNIKDMEKFLDEAMNSSEDLYVSDPNLYIDHVINVLELLPNITTNLD